MNELIVKGTQKILGKEIQVIEGWFGKDNLVENEDIISAEGLFDWLVANKYLIADDDAPYQTYIDKGYFKVIERTHNTAFGTKLIAETLVTGKGQIKLVEKLKKEFSK